MLKFYADTLIPEGTMLVLVNYVTFLVFVWSFVFFVPRLVQRYIQVTGSGVERDYSWIKGHDAGIHLTESDLELLIGMSKVLNNVIIVKKLGFD